MTFKWFISAAIVPIVSMLIGISVTYLTESQVTVNNTQCVVAIKSPREKSEVIADMMVTSNGIVIEANKAGVFIVPCNLSGVRVSLHTSKTRNLIGYTRLELSEKKMQIIDQYYLDK